MAGGDHGVTVMSRHDPVTGTTATALANIETPTFGRARQAMDAAKASVGDPS